MSGVLRIDVQTTYGTNIGAGPIMTATKWTNKPRLDRAGDFSFDMPASDPRAAYIQPRRYVRAYYLVNGAITEVGAGIVDDIQVVGGSGPTMLHISGNDLLRELSWRTCGPTLYLNESGYASPGAMYKLHISASSGFMIDGTGTVTTDPTAAGYLYYTNAIDGNAGTSVFVAGDDNSHRIYFQYSLPFNAIKFTFSTPCVAAGATWGTLQYYTSSTTFTGWQNVTFTDNTISGGKSWGQNGTFTFTQPSDWSPLEQVIYNGVEYINLTGYWLRLQGSLVNPTSATISEVTVSSGVPTLNSLSLPIAFAPAGWALDGVSGFTTTAMPVYSVSCDDTVMACLTKISDLTFEHFRLGTGRQVTWLRKTTPNSGVRCVRLTDGVDLGSNALVCGITALTKDTPTASLATRVIPYGAGTGLGRLTLANTSRDTDAVNPLPAGYTFDRTNNHIVNTTAEGIYGQVDAVQVWSNVGPFSTATAEQAPAANALWDVALYWLQVNSDTTAVYTLTVGGLNTTVLPGQTVHVTWLEIVNGYTVLSIDADLIVLEAVNQIDQTGVRTVGLTVSSQPVWPESDAEVLANALVRQHHAAAYPQMFDLSTVTVAYQTTTSSGGTLAATGGGGAYSR